MRGDASMRGPAGSGLHVGRAGAPVTQQRAGGSGAAPESGDASRMRSWRSRKKIWVTLRVIGALQERTGLQVAVPADRTRRLGMRPVSRGGQRGDRGDCHGAPEKPPLGWHLCRPSASPSLFLLSFPPLSPSAPPPAPLSFALRTGLLSVRHVGSQGRPAELRCRRGPFRPLWDLGLCSQALGGLGKAPHAVVGALT